MMTHQRKKNVCDEYGDIVSDKQALNNHKENHKNKIRLTQSSTIVRVFPCPVCSQVTIFLYINIFSIFSISKKKNYIFASDIPNFQLSIRRLSVLVFI